MSDSSAASDNKLGESPAVDLVGKTMVMAVIVLFAVVVFVLGFHLYAKGFWWHVPQSPRRRRFAFAFASGQDGALRSGLDPSVLRSLPVMVFQPQDFKDGLECAVCLSELAQGEKARLLPKCNHGFHLDCIDMWFQSHATCPLCRTSVASSTTANDDPTEDNESSGTENSDGVSGLESPTFPTNVLIWGNQTQISSTGACASLEESTSQPPCPSSSSGESCGANNNRRHGMLIIDIPGEITPSSLSPSPDEMKSPVTGRLRSLKRLLSRDSRLNPWSPTSTSTDDVEQAKGKGGQN